MTNKNKRGFTIVELVIVIAVIAILAAVLIPTFAGIINTSKTSSDIQLVKNLNLALATAEATDGKNPTMHDALADAKEAGYDVTKLTPTNDDNDILWDQTCDRFVLKTVDEYHLGGRYEEIAVPSGANEYKLWMISDKIEENYSTYYTGTETTISTDKGFDAGNSNVTNVTYSNNSGAKTVIIRTNSASTTLTINAPSDTVDHHGNVGTVDIEKIDMACYNEFGFAGFVKISEGAVIVKEGGVISVVFANNSDGSLVAVIAENGGRIDAGYTTLQAVDTANRARANGIELAYSNGSVDYTSDDINSLGEEAVANLVAEELKNDPNVVATIGTKGYASFKEAVAAAQPGDTINVVSDSIVIDESIGTTNSNGLNNRVVLNADTMLTFKNTAKVYMTNNGEFVLNGNTLYVIFDTSCDANQQSGFMNCTIGDMYHGLHEEYWEYDNSNRSAVVYKDFRGDENTNNGLIFTSEFYVYGGFAGQDDDLAYDESIAYGYENNNYNFAITLGKDNETSEFYTARIYLDPNAKGYTWETYSTSHCTYNASHYDYNGTGDEEVVKIIENHGSYVVIKGVSGDYGTIGKGAIVKVTITNPDNTTTVYEWKITVTLGLNGPSNPGFDFPDF